MMNANQNSRRLALTVFASLLAATVMLTANRAAVAQENPDKILKKVRENYEKLESLTADFEKNYTWTQVGETQTLSGKIYLKRGDRYRVETGLQTIVTDGKTVWTYTPSKQQVYLDKMEGSHENPLPRELLAKYATDYRARYLRKDVLDGVSCHVILLTPRDENAFVESVTVWVDANQWLTVQVEQVDLNENLTVYKMSNLALNEKLSDHLFSFEIPKDVEIIDLR